MDYFYEDCIKPRKNKKFLVLGKNNNPDSIMLVSNDYLGISTHSAIAKAQIEAIKKQGNGVLMSAIFMQGENPKFTFEENMAKYMNFESSILCQSGLAANVGLVQSIANKDTPVYIDFMAHMSLWEGIKSAGAKAYPFRHNDYEHLEKLIQRNGQGVILVDSVYSTNGSICPLKEVVTIGNKYDCIIVVDESHSLGTHGPKGSGMVAELGLSNNVHFITASLAKAFAGRAGIIACSKEFTEYFPYTSYNAIFSSVLLPHEIAGLQATLDVIKNSDERRVKLRENTNYLKFGLDNIGYNVTESNSQIIALNSGLEEYTEILRDSLENRNIFGSVFCRPATPKKHSLMRFSISSILDSEVLDYILKVCDEIKDEVDLKNWYSTRAKKLN